MYKKCKTYNPYILSKTTSVVSYRVRACKAHAKRGKSVKVRVSRVGSVKVRVSGLDAWVPRPISFTRDSRVDDVTLGSTRWVPRPISFTRDSRVDDVTLGSTRDSRVDDVTLVFMTSLSLALAFREFYPRIGSTWC